MLVRMTINVYSAMVGRYKDVSLQGRTWLGQRGEAEVLPLWGQVWHWLYWAEFPGKRAAFMLGCRRLSGRRGRGWVWCELGSHTRHYLPQVMHKGVTESHGFNIFTPRGSPQVLVLLAVAVCRGRGRGLVVVIDGVLDGLLDSVLDGVLWRRSF